MNRIAKIAAPIIAGLILISSCNDKGTDSPFGETLSQPPYAGLTDSIKQEPQNDDFYFRRAVLLNTNNLPEPALADFKKAWAIKKAGAYKIAIPDVYFITKLPEEAGKAE